MAVHGCSEIGAGSIKMLCLMHMQDKFKIVVPNLDASHWEAVVHTAVWKVGRHFGFQAFNMNPKTQELVRCARHASLSARIVRSLRALHAWGGLASACVHWAPVQMGGACSHMGVAYCC